MKIPNGLIDNFLPHLTHMELITLLSIMRIADGSSEQRKISATQLMKMTGRRNGSTRVLRAVKSLVQLGLIKKNVVGENGTQSTFYEIVEEKMKDKEF